MGDADEYFGEGRVVGGCDSCEIGTRTVGGRKGKMRTGADYGLKSGAFRKAKGELSGSGFLSDLGIPIISNIAGAIGLGKGGRRKGGVRTGGAEMMGGARSGGALGEEMRCPMCKGMGVTGGAMPFAPRVERGSSAVRQKVTKMAERRAYEDSAMHGSGFLEDIGRVAFQQLSDPQSITRRVALPFVAEKVKQKLEERKKTRGGARKPNARAEIVKKVMREKGLSMIEASKYVKANGLY